jgi:hypothetical protein
VQEAEEQQYVSALPFLPVLTDKTLSTYYTYYAGFFTLVIVFGALLAPILEVCVCGGGGGPAWQRRPLGAGLVQSGPVAQRRAGGRAGPSAEQSAEAAVRLLGPLWQTQLRRHRH